MSLDWNVTKVKDCDNVCFKKDEKGERDGLQPVTEALIWYTMITGVGWGVTEDNVEEFYARIALWEKLHNPMVIGGGGEGYQPITREQVLAHVGLSTNVSYEPRDEWLNRVFTNWAKEQGAKIGPLEKGVVTIKYDSTRPYNQWTVYDTDGTVERRCYSLEEAEELKAELEEQHAAEDDED